MEPRPRRILRKPEARRRIPVGKTKFEEDIAPRLDKVRLGPRCVGFTEDSVERVIDELIAESANIPDFVPTPNKKLAKAAAPKTPKSQKEFETA
jgi:predicted DNA-binding transcriptional regulator AlpA